MFSLSIVLFLVRWMLTKSKGQYTINRLWSYLILAFRLLTRASYKFPFFSALYICGGVIFTDVIYIIYAICYITVVRATLFDWATAGMGICSWRTFIVCICHNHGNAARSKNDRRIFNIKATFNLDSLVVECWHRGPGFNPQSRTAS
mgnify:CR=1 FL=1